MLPQRAAHVTPGRMRRIIAGRPRGRAALQPALAVRAAVGHPLGTMKKLPVAIALLTLSIAAPVFACPMEGSSEDTHTAEKAKDAPKASTAKAADKAKASDKAKDAKPADKAKTADKISKK
jgi:hypothetical protein